MFKRRTLPGSYFQIKRGIGEKTLMWYFFFSVVICTFFVPYITAKKKSLCDHFFGMIMEILYHRMPKCVLGCSCMSVNSFNHEWISMSRQNTFLWEILKEGNWRQALYSLKIWDESKKSYFSFFFRLWLNITVRIDLCRCARTTNLPALFWSERVNTQYYILFSISGSQYW